MVKRLTEMVAKNALNNTIQAGIFTFFISEKRVEKLEKSKLAIFDKIRSMDETDDFEIEIKAKTTIIETGSEDDSGAWCSVTILLYLKEKQ